MFKRKALTRFNLYLSLFAVLLITICPVITQTIALLGESSLNATHHAPSLSHFECASQFYKENQLNPNDFLEVQKDTPIFDQTITTNTSAADANGIVSCGYCDLLHSASMLIEFNATLFEYPTADLYVVATTNPYVLSLNYWSILTRAPPTA